MVLINKKPFIHHHIENCVKYNFKIFILIITIKRNY